MTKTLTVFTLLLLLCGCSLRRAHKDERFLLLQSPQDKIAIVTVLPEAGDSTGSFASSIFMNNFTGSKGQSIAFTYTYDQSTGECMARNYFIDSLMPVSQRRFPVLLAPALRDSTVAFRYFMGRRKAVLETGPPVQSATKFAVSYPKQRHFGTRSEGNDFAIDGMLPIGARLTNLNGRLPDQPSVFSLHCLGNGGELFLRDASSWFWIDCTLDTATYHVFFERDGSGLLNVHYSTFPDAFSIHLEQDPGTLHPFITIRSASGENVVLRLLAPAREHLPENPFYVDAVTLIRNGSKVGNGILYRL